MTAPKSSTTAFSTACGIRPLGDGTFTADLPADWTIGGKPHGGFLIALLAKAAVALHTAGGAQLIDPLAVSAQFLHPPGVGPVLLRTDLRKSGRTATVVAVSIEQRGRSCVEGVVTTGRLPRDRAAWTDLPNQPAEPPGTALELSTLSSAAVMRLSGSCDVRLDPAGASFLHGHLGDLRLRLWARPRGDQVDPLFALVAGDISMPVTFNLGRLGWSPTVQLTALLRSRPAPGWLRIQVDCRAVHGLWFDSDATVVDSTGRLICQARQLALTPAP